MQEKGILLFLKVEKGQVACFVREYKDEGLSKNYELVIEVVLTFIDSFFRGVVVNLRCNFQGLCPCSQI